MWPPAPGLEPGSHYRHQRRIPALISTRPRRGIFNGIISSSIKGCTKDHSNRRASPTIIECLTVYYCCYTQRLHKISDPPLSSRHTIPDPLSRPRLVDVVHRACDGHPSRPPAVVVVTWLGGHTRGMAPGVEPPTARLGHPGDVHFGPLKPISFIPWFRNGPIGPKGSYKNTMSDLPS